MSLTTSPNPLTIARACAEKALRETATAQVSQVFPGIYEVNRGRGHSSQIVGPLGCTCRHFKEIVRPNGGAACTHTFCVFLATGEWVLPEDPEPYVTEEVRAEETLAALDAGRRERVARMMGEDFGDQ